VEIRPYRETDVPAVLALWREVFPNAPAHNVPSDDIRRKLRVQRELFLVAVEGDALVGVAMAGYDGHRGGVYYLAVDPQRRRQGIGSALMRHAETAMAELGCPKVNIMVRTSNADVLPFYERLGYEGQDIITVGKRLE